MASSKDHESRGSVDSADSKKSAPGSSSETSSDNGHQTIKSEDESTNIALHDSNLSEKNMQPSNEPHHDNSSNNKKSDSAQLNEDTSEHTQNVDDSNLLVSAVETSHHHNAGGVYHLANHTSPPSTDNGDLHENQNVNVKETMVENDPSDQEEHREAKEISSFSENSSESKNQLVKKKSKLEKNRFPVQFEWENIEYVVKVKSGPLPCMKKKKVVLHPMSGFVRPGEILAIMGPSGAGKTSLLNILARRVRNFTGDMRVNGRKIGRSFNNYSAYVEQDDVFQANLTVKQTLLYSAFLRLPTFMSAAKKIKRVNEVIRLLGLQKCQNTFIGAPGGAKGISGGERKRCAIAQEILKKPSLLFLDEPTSGLDSAISLSVVQAIKNLAKEGTTVIMTVHQPRSQIFAQFDKLLLLAQGKIAYFGAAKDVDDYFTNLDSAYTVPHGFNVADHVIDLITKSSDVSLNKIQYSANAQLVKNDDIELSKIPISEGDHQESGDPDHKNNSAEGENQEESELIHDQENTTASGEAESNKDESITAKQPPVKDELVNRSSTVNPEAILEDPEQARIDRILDHYEKYGKIHIPPFEGKANLNKIPSYGSNFFLQFIVLLIRNFNNTVFDRQLTIGKVIQTIIMVIFLGALYFRMDDDQSNLQDRKGLLFFVMMNTIMGSLFAVLSTWPAEFKVFKREYHSRAYRIGAYFLAKVSSELPHQIFFPIFFGALLYWVVNFHGTAGRFFAFLVIVVANALCGISIGEFLSIAAPKPELGLILAPVLILALVLFGGFYLTVSNIPVYWLWVYYLSMFNYGYSALVINEFDGKTLYCKPDQFLPNGQCPITDGRQVLKSLDMDREYYWVFINVAILLAMTFALKASALFILYAKTTGLSRKIRRCCCCCCCWPCLLCCFCLRRRQRSTNVIRGKSEKEMAHEVEKELVGNIEMEISDVANVKDEEEHMKEEIDEQLDEEAQLSADKPDPTV